MRVLRAEYARRRVAVIGALAPVAGFVIAMIVAGVLSLDREAIIAAAALAGAAGFGWSAERCWLGLALGAWSGFWVSLLLTVPETPAGLALPMIAIMVGAGSVAASVLARPAQAVDLVPLAHTVHDMRHRPALPSGPAAPRLTATPGAQAPEQ